MSVQAEIREAITIENQGLKIFGVMHTPTTEPPWPAVLLLHGFAGNKVGRTRQYVQVAHSLAQQGIAALRIDYRGCGDSEGRFSEMHMAEHVSDANKSLDFLRNMEGIDPQRIGLIGRSLGGPIAIQTAKDAGDIKSLALWAPVSNGGKFKHEWEIFQKHAKDEDLMWLNNLPFQTGFIKQFFREFFELKPAEALRHMRDMPLLHVHGEQDNVVPEAHVKEYQSYRNGAKAETRWLRLPDCDHDFFAPRDQIYLVEQTTQWFKETL